MKTRIRTLVMTSALALSVSVLALGCDRTITKEEKTSVSSDGTVKTKEKSVVEKPDGTIIKTEENKKTEPVK